MAAKRKKPTIVVHMLEGLPNEIYGPDDVEVVLVVEEEHGDVTAGRHVPRPLEEMHRDMKEAVKATRVRGRAVRREWSL